MSGEIPIFSINFEFDDGTDAPCTFTEEARDALFPLYSSIRTSTPEELVAIAEGVPDEHIRYLFVLVFYIRDVIEGEGKRDHFYALFRYMWKRCPDGCLAVARRIPDYGAWFDMYRMFPHPRVIKGRMHRQHELYKPDDEYKDLIAHFTDLYVEYLIYDYYTVLTSNNMMCYAGKWAPREGKHYHWFSKCIAHNETFQRILPDMAPYTRYRKVVTEITRRISPVEIFICADKTGKTSFADIDFYKLSVAARRKYWNALMATGDEDRNKCSAKFKAFVRSMRRNPDMPPHEKVVPEHTLEHLETTMKSERYQQILEELEYEGI